MILLGKIALGGAATVLAGVGALCSEGFVNVNVVQYQRHGNEPQHIHVIAPALIAPIAIRLVPDDKLDKPARQLQPFIPAVRAALDGLSDTDDMTLVEVNRRDEYALVRKDGGDLVIDVTNREEKVHVSVPLRAIESTFEALAAAAPAPGQDTATSF
jgi:hypothetical protein